MMKKIFGYILTLIFSFGIINVEAETISLEQVTKKIEEIIKDENTSELNFSVENTTDSLTINSDDGFFIKFDYKNNILSTKHSLKDLSMAMRYSSGLALVTQAVVILNGYTEEEWQLYNDIENAKLEINGYEYHPNTSYEMEYFININKINLDINSDEENLNGTIDKDENEITFVEPKAKPENITIKEIAEKLPSVFKKIYSEQFGEIVAENSSNFSVEYDYNTITIFQEIDEKKETLRTLTINDGVISHEYIYDTELGVDGERIVNVFIYKSLFMTIGEIYGYNDKELEFLYSQFFEAKYDDYGYEFVLTKERSNFKMDINRFNLKKVVEEVPDEEVEINTGNDSEGNSNSSTVFVIMIIIVIVSLCLLFYINRDMFGNMLRNRFRR